MMTKAMKKELLKINDLSIAYNTPRGKLHAVRNVNLTVHENEVVALIGESGCGKTTLCLSIVQLDEDNAQLLNGEINYYKDGEVKILTQMSERDIKIIRWQEIALMFQASQSVFNPVIKIKEHFIDTVKAHDNGYSRKVIIDKSKNLLSKMQLDADRVLNSYAHELSGGMKQRALIALSFILDPKIVIFDEPTTALDVLTQRKIIDLLRLIKEEYDFSIIIITHDLAIAAELADKVATMYAGQIVENGKTEDIFYSPSHPYSYGLINAVPKLISDKCEGDLSSIPGSPPDLIDIENKCQFSPRCNFATEECFRDEPTIIKVGESHFVACYNYKNVPPIRRDN